MGTIELPPASILLALCPACQHGKTCRGYRKGEAANDGITCLAFKPVAARPKDKMTPAHVLALPDREPCSDCACRADTTPNGTPHTMATFKQCVEDLEPFLCHEDGAGRVCAGWVRAVKARVRP